MRRLKAIAILLALLHLAPAAGLAEDYESLLDRGLRSDEAYSAALIRQAAGAPDKGEVIAEALRFSPDLPAVYFKMAMASLPNVIKHFEYFAGGLRAYGRNFWWSLSLYGQVLASLMISLCLSLAVVVLIRLPRQIPLIAHDINEHRAKLLIPLILLPAALGGPVFFLAGALVLVGIHLRKSSRAAVGLALAVLVAAPFMLRYNDAVLSAPASAEMKAIVAVNEGKDNTYAIDTLEGSTEPAARFSYALALKREGRYLEAISIYNELAKDRPSWKVLNNLANAYSALQQDDLAKETYSKAYEMDPNANVLYNLSQVYRGTLDYARGDKYYQDASALDRALVSEYTARSSENPNRFVVDVVHSMPELWELALKRSRPVYSPFTLGTAPSVGLAAVLLAAYAALALSLKSVAFNCSRCSKVACNICSRESRFGNICHECFEATMALKDIDRQQRVQALLSTHEHKARQRSIVRALSFAPPGIAQIYVGNVLSGLILLWAFAFGAVFIWMNPYISTGLAGFSHGWLTPIAIAMMAATYLGSTITINGRLDSGWL